jgi:fructose-1,6-bisphosphatase I
VELVIADENEVKLYRLQNGEFNFIKNIKLNEKGKLNASGGTQKNWFPYHKEMIDSIFKSGYRLRYSGGMVPDLHQILLKGGGLFSYPATSDVPKGKLRMVFEVFPFAFVYEKAGGEAIDGQKRLLELSPSHIHDTTPCFFGSKEEIGIVRKTYDGK